MDKRKLSAVSLMPQYGITHPTSFQRLLGGCFCLFLMLALATISNGNQNGKLVISSLEETTKDMQSVPCKDKDRLDATKALFVKLGAPADQVSVEKHDGVENLVIRKTGKSQGTIVIGAHLNAP